jgi:hypothetical protein
VKACVDSINMHFSLMSIINFSKTSTSSRIVNCECQCYEMSESDSYLWLYSPFSGLGSFFNFLIFYTVNRTSWTGDQSVARPLPAHRTAQTQNKGTQASVAQVGFEPTIPVFERAKTVHVLDRAATVLGTNQINIDNISSSTLTGLLPFKMNYEIITNFIESWQDFWTGDQPVYRPLPTWDNPHTHTHTE